MWTLLLLLALAGAAIFASTDRVKKVHLGLPESIFHGRKTRIEGQKYSIPIREPYNEGLIFKAPWIIINQISREIQTSTIDEDFPTTGGGTVKAKALIQWRASYPMLYRFDEVDNKAIDEGLKSEIKQLFLETILGTACVGGQDDRLEAVLEQSSVITEKLRLRLQGHILNPRRTAIKPEEMTAAEPEERRTLFGCEISYSEQNYGIEVVKVSLSLHLPEELKKDREAQQREKYQQKSESTEWDHLLEKMELLKKKYPNLSDEQALQAVQVWRKQITKDVKEIRINDLEALAKVAQNIFGGKKT